MAKSAPLALRPEVVERHLLIDRATGARTPDPAIGPIVAAFTRVHGELGNLSQLQAALQADPTLPPAARAMKLRDAALAVGEKAAKALDGARERAEAARRQLEVETLPAPRDPALASEIRSAMRQMDPLDRSKMLAEAVTAGDAETIGATLAAPRYLSGLADAQAVALTHEWRRLHHPGALDRIDRIAKAQADLDRGSGALLAQVRALTADPQAAMAAAAQQRSAEAHAALEAAE